MDKDRRSSPEEKLRNRRRSLEHLYGPGIMPSYPYGAGVHAYGYGGYGAAGAFGAHPYAGGYGLNHPYSRGLGYGHGYAGGYGGHGYHGGYLGGLHGYPHMAAHYDPRVLPPFERRQTAKDLGNRFSSPQHRNT